MDLKYKPKLRIFGQIDKAVFSCFCIDLDNRLSPRENISKNRSQCMVMLFS